jgi:hypothetical protein
MASTRGYRISQHEYTENIITAQQQKKNYAKSNKQSKQHVGTNREQ